MQMNLILIIYYLWVTIKLKTSIFYNLKIIKVKSFETKDNKHQD